MKTMSALADLGRQMVLLGTYEDTAVCDIINVLKAADDLYYNEAESFLSDAEYDSLRQYAQGVEPQHSYFTGVGSEVRGGKIKLPYPMGSLDQIQVGEIADWVGNWSLQREDMVLTDKLDGTSAMLIYDDAGHIQIAYSRGDGVQGADITRHLRHFVPTTAHPGLVVRGEVILTKKHFKVLQSKVMTRGGKPYKNARNMVAGLMNASKNDPIVYQYLHFVAYDIPASTLGKMQLLGLLDDLGFMTPYAKLTVGSQLTDQVLSNFLKQRRERTEYEIDGLVIDADEPYVRKRMNPTRDTLNPAYSVKYKVADASNMAIARVIKVEWRPSKHGYLKPRVHIEPVELVGVTVQHATGFNAKFIIDNGIGPDAQVRITRSGDVIPFILGVVKKSPNPCTPGKFRVDWEWNDTAVDAVLLEDTDDVHIERLVAFFTAIDAPLLKKGNIIKLYEAGYTTTEEIIQLAESEFVRILGSNGSKVYAGLRKVLTNIPVWKLMGSTNFFGRGMGSRKMKKLLAAVANPANLLSITQSRIARIDGFDKTSAKKILAGIEDYYVWAGQLETDGFITVDYNMSVVGGSMEGQNVVFTGFRDKALAKQVEDEGGNIQSTVSGKTTILVAANPKSGSAKMKKAREMGVMVIGIDELRDML